MFVIREDVITTLLLLVTVALYDHDHDHDCIIVITMTIVSIQLFSTDGQLSFLVRVPYLYYSN